MLIQFQDKQVHVEVYGEGEPIVLLNGVMMTTMSWAPFIEAISKQNKLILLDFLDQGQSSPMSEAYDVTLHADTLSAVLDELGLEQASVAGISYGSFVAQQFALKYPARVKKLVLFNTAAYASPWLIDIGQSWQAARSSPEGYYYATMPIIYSQTFYNENQEWLNARKEFLVKHVFTNESFFEAMDRRLDSAATHDVRERLGEIKAKTLVVGSRNDYLVPVDEQKFVCDRIPDADLVVLENCGHASMYERPDAFMAVLTGFVNNEPVVI